MFKKRGVFNKQKIKSTGGKDNISADTDADTSTNVDITHDDIIPEDIALPSLKKQKTRSGITFKKKKTGLNPERSTTKKDADVVPERKDFDESDGPDGSVNSYFDQFDDYELDKAEGGETGIGASRDHTHDDENDSDDLTTSIVFHRLTPPFLDSKSIMISNSQLIDVIKDKSGDLYRYSKNGSFLLNEKRKMNDYLKNTKDDISQGKFKKIVNVKSQSEPADEIAGGTEREEEFQAETEEGEEDPFEKTVEQFNRENLPAYKIKDTLMELINENQVVIVIGETGSGKTTQLPQFLFEQGYHKNGLIGITQPRRMAAVSVAKRVSEEMNVKLGNEVGYTIRFNDSTSNSTNIKFMTDGVLLRETLNDATLNKYSCIIMDEAHERSLNTDILFGIFKNLLIKRRDFKLIITSATMNSLKFSKFFNNAIQFKIPGKTFPVDIMYQAVPSVDYIDSAVKQALKIHLSNPFKYGDNGDILIFMTGQEDITISCQILDDELKKLKKINSNILDLDILPIYSNLSSELQEKIFENSKNRKCIIATNIAETSLTLHHVKFVIDSGLMKLKIFNPKLNMDILQIVPISKAQAKQRSGRAGRVCPGQCFRLYTLSSYEDEMWDEPIPEIQRSNLMSTILLLKNLNIKNINRFPFIDKPSFESIETSQYELWSIGALDNFGNLTKLGRLMTQFPIDPILSKLLIISNFKAFGCCVEILKIVSMLSVPQIFIRPKNDSNLQKKADKIRENFQIEYSDHLTLLNIFNQFENTNMKSKELWCNKNYFNYKSLKNAVEIFMQLKLLFEKTLKKDELLTSCYNDWEIIKECLCAGFYLNAAEIFKHAQYKHCRSGLEMYLHPTSVLNDMGDLPKYIIYHELLLTGRKQHMNYITAVKGEWLVKYGSIFYSKRVRGISIRENQKMKEEKFNKLIEFEKAKTETF